MEKHPPIQRGVACPGCPHRAAYVICKEALGRGRGKVICGDVGCPLVGPMHPAACTCEGGEDALLDRYKTSIPSSGSPQAPALDACIHFVSDAALAHDDAARDLDGLAGEGRVTVLAVLASSKDHLSREGVEGLANRALDLGCEGAIIVDPFDSQRTTDVLSGALARPGVHAVVFASPCARLHQGPFEAEPVEIDEYACMACHRCKQITGCPAISFTPPVFRIDPEACSGCDLCVDYCRTHVIYSPRSRMTPEEKSRARYAAANQEKS